jgi:topoisomerase-4 subunit A
MRLRALRKLEEMEIRKEHKKLSAEQKKLQGLMKSEKARWDAIAEELEATRQKFGDGALGKRRTTPGAALPEVAVDEMAFVEKEPITVILSEKGWIRAQKGHLPDEAELRFKEGDAEQFRLHAQTTDRIVLFATNGRAFTLKAEAIPRGRGDGQPVRLMVDLSNEDAIVTLFVHHDGAKWLLAATDGKGFVVKGEELLAEKRTGKQVLLVDPPKEACVCIPAEGDSVAVTANDRLLVFPLDQIPEMARGRGVQLIGLKDGELKDVQVFTAKEGLAWKYGSGVRVETDLRTWRGQRAAAGKSPPPGFPRNRRFGV